MALDLAMTRLPDGNLKTELKSCRTKAAEKLCTLLGAVEEPKERDNTSKRRDQRDALPTKKARKDGSKPSQASLRREDNVSQQQTFPTVLDSTLLAALSIRSEDDAKEEAQLDPLIAIMARFPPPPNSIRRYLEQQFPSLKNKDDAIAPNVLLSAASDALKICNGVAAGVSMAPEAVTVFEPVVSLLCELKDALSLDDFVSHPDVDRTILSTAEDLSSRVIQCMHILLMEHDVVSHSSQGGFPEDAASRWWLRWNPRTTALIPEISSSKSTDIANSLAMKVIALKRWLSSANTLLNKGRPPPFESVVAWSAYDMKLLEPFAAHGHLLSIEETELKNWEECMSQEGKEISRFLECWNTLALYCAAAEVVTHDLSVPTYFTFMAATRRASLLAEDAIANHIEYRGSRIDAGLAAKILEDAAALYPPLDASQWLQEQPPSLSITACLESYAHGPAGLSRYLALKASLKRVRALAAAARAGGVALGSERTTDGNRDKGSERNDGDDQESGEDSDRDQEEVLDDATDELLFFVSKEGEERSMFGQEWYFDVNDAGEGAAGEDEQMIETSTQAGKKIGVDLDALSQEFESDEGDHGD